jgi:hypothetical protein
METPKIRTKANRNVTVILKVGEAFTAKDDSIKSH